MANYTYHEFGAFIKITTRQREVTPRYLECISCDFVSYGELKFCPHCGCALLIPDSVMKHPGNAWDILGTDNEDLRFCGIEDIWEKGTIYAMDNTGTGGSHWLRVGPYRRDIFVKEFPTEAQIEDMKAALIRNCTDALKLLEESPLVESFEIGAGYVLNEEF